MLETRGIFEAKRRKEGWALENIEKKGNSSVMLFVIYCLFFSRRITPLVFIYFPIRNACCRSLSHYFFFVIMLFPLSCISFPSLWSRFVARSVWASFFVFVFSPRSSCGVLTSTLPPLSLTRAYAMLQWLSLMSHLTHFDNENCTHPPRKFSL